MSNALFPFARHVTPDVVALNAGHLVMGFELEGRPFETLDVRSLAERRERLNLAYRALADDRLALWVHQTRRPMAPPRPAGRRSMFGEEVATAHRRALEDRGLWRVRQFAWIVGRAEAGHDLERRLRQAQRRGAELDAGLLKRVRQAGADFEALFEDARPRRLGVTARLNLPFSEPLEALRLILFSDPSPTPLNDGPLSEALHDRRIIFGRESFEIRDVAEARYGACLGIKTYPAETRAGQLDSLLSAPFAFSLSQSFAYLTPAAARGVLERKQNQLVSARDRARSQVEGLDTALDELVSQKFVMGEHQASLTVFAETPAALHEALSLARARLADAGFVASREDLALEAAVRAQAPGAFRWRTRPAAITSRNLAAFAPFHAPPRATGTSPQGWGSLMTLRGPTGVGLAFGLHQGDLGHTFICGPSGSGKTVLQGLILTELERLGARRLLIDKDRGAEAFVRANEGAYLTLHTGRPTGLAPFKALQDTPEDRAFLSTLVGLLARPASGDLDPVDRLRLDEALEALWRLPPADRSVEALRPLLGAAPGGLGARLGRYGDSGPLGWALDGADDLLTLDADLIGMDVTELLDQPEVRAPVLAYLFHRIGQRLDGRRLVLDIDEFWKVLDDPAFAAFARDGLKTWRKRNGVLIFATQSPSDVLASPIASAVLEQCATFLFLPNPQGQARDYVEGFGLTPAEFDLVRRGLKPRQVLIRQGPVSAIAEFDLGQADEVLPLLSGRAASVRQLERLIADHGPAYRAWRSPFHASRSTS